MAEWFLAVQTLIENHTDTPDVHFGRDLGRILADDKTLGWEIPTRKRKKRRGETFSKKDRKYHFADQIKIQNLKHFLAHGTRFDFCGVGADDYLRCCVLRFVPLADSPVGAGAL